MNISDNKNGIIDNKNFATLLEHCRNLEERIRYYEMETKFTHRLAINLETMCLNPTQGYNASLECLGEYHDAVNKMHEAMGERTTTLTEMNLI